MTGVIAVEVTTKSVVDVPSVGIPGDEGRPGVPGPQGVGISTLTVDGSGNLLVELTNKAQINAGYVKGDKGGPGDNGVSITDAAVDIDGHLYISLSNSDVLDAGFVTGDKGNPGANGVSITGASVNGSNHLILTRSIGADIDAGLIVFGGDMSKSTYDSNGNGKVDVAESAEAVTWVNVSGKPGSITALASYDNNGLMVQTAKDTFTARSIKGTTDQIRVTDGGGASGDPTVALTDAVKIVTSITIPNTGLKLKDTDASHDVTLKVNSNVTAARAINFVIGDADRTLDLTQTLSSHVEFVQSQSNDAAAAFDFTTGFATGYDKYVFVIRSIVPSTTGSNIDMQVSENGGTNFLGGGLYAWATPLLSSSYSRNIGTGANFFRISDTVAPGNPVSGIVRVIRQSASYCRVFAEFSHNPSGNPSIALATGFVITSTIANAVRFVAENGNNLAATIDMYRVRNT